MRIKVNTKEKGRPPENEKAMRKTIKMPGEAFFESSPGGCALELYQALAPHRWRLVAEKVDDGSGDVGKAVFAVVRL